jgi:tetratricopeptide (TPR) repeat protein
MILFSVVSIINSPWSAEWNCSKAMRFHEKMKLKEAKKYYSRALSINPESQCANDNLLVIKIAELSKKALELHQEKKYVEAGKVYDEILKLDPRNSWALENKSRLP